LSPFHVSLDKHRTVIRETFPQTRKPKPSTRYAGSSVGSSSQRITRHKNQNKKKESAEIFKEEERFVRLNFPSFPYIISIFPSDID
jgi:hypothetical protein